MTHKCHPGWFSEGWSTCAVRSVDVALSTSTAAAEVLVADTKLKGRGVGVVATIAYLGYRDAMSGVLISLAVGVVYAIGSLIQLDLAARVCRPETAGTTFALLMSLTNLGTALWQGIGGSAYEAMAARWGY